MSMFTVRPSGDVAPLQWDSDEEESEHEDVPARVKRARLQKELKAAKAKISLLDDDDDLNLLDSDDEARGKDQGSECDELEMAAHAGKPLLASPVKASKPAGGGVRLDPKLQQEALRARERLAELKRQAQEPTELSDPSSGEEEEPGPSGKGEVAADEVKVALKIKSSAMPDGLMMRIGMSQPFSRLYAAYEQAGLKDGWLPDGATVTLLFDGDKVQPDDTPASLDIDNNEVIDAQW